MKPKSNQKGSLTKVSGYDSCQTPPYALAPLLPFLPKDKIIWEPATGERILENELWLNGHSVIGSDLVTGDNFFEYQPFRWDLITTNPAYSIKRKWLKRSYELGKPFALLVPLETIGSSEVQDLLDLYGFEMMLLDARVDFKMPNVGWGGTGAQFPVIWLTWKILPEKVMLGKMKAAKKKWITDNKEMILADKARVAEEKKRRKELENV
jgi:hypothetical protein